METEENIIINYLNEEITDTPNLLNKKLTKNGEPIKSRQELENIKKQVNQFINNKKNNRFLVLPGLRGVGKTTLLYQTYNYLIKEKQIPPKQILYMSCDELNSITKQNIKQVIEIYLKQIHETTLRTLNKNIFLLIDEAQYDKKWSQSGKIIYDKTENIFMIFTGSSALDLEYNADAARRMNKKIITPLNYNQHLKLKHNIILPNISQALEKLIFTGNPDDAIKCEKKVNDTLINNIEYTTQDWEEYKKYGGFPFSFEETDPDEIASKINDVVEKIVNTDLMRFKNLSFENQSNAKRILRFIALQEPGEISQNKLSNYLRTSAGNIKNMLDILEKTQVIFPCQPYGGPAKRIKKAWKYYFATSSLHNILSNKYYNHMKKTTQFEGILNENLVASTLFNYKNQNKPHLSIYYDDRKEKNVDFLIQEEFQKIIPIEVGRKSKKKTQIYTAINKYNTDYGIIISQATEKITKEDNVIHIPIQTFALL